MTSFKIYGYFFVGFYIIFQLIAIIPQLSKTKTITVYKRNYEDSNAYIKGYKAENGSVVTFNVKVTPNDFWDRFLLTNQDGNLLSDIFKIITCLVFVFYIYNLTYENIFANKSFNLFWLIFILLVLSYLSNDIGRSYTKDFYRDLFTAHGGDADTVFDFQMNAKLSFTSIFMSMFYWISLSAINLYRTFKNHHEGKEEEDF